MHFLNYILICLKEKFLNGIFLLMLFQTTSYTETLELNSIFFTCFSREKRPQINFPRQNFILEMKNIYFSNQNQTKLLKSTTY